MNPEVSGNACRAALARFNFRADAALPDRGDLKRRSNAARGSGLRTLGGDYDVGAADA